MISDEYLEGLAEGAGMIAADLSDQIIQEVVRRFVARFYRSGEISFTRTDVLQLQVLQEAGYLLGDIRQLIIQATKVQAREIDKALKDAGITALKNDNAIYQRVGLPISDMSPSMVRLISRQYEATMGLWFNYTRTTAISAQQAYIMACDRAANLVASGAMSYTQAVMEGLKTIPKNADMVLYDSGHRDTIETATLRAVRTSAGQTAGQVTAMRAAENNVHLMIVSSHIGARPEHALWQGKVYYVDWLALRIATGIDYPLVDDDPDLRSRYPDFVEKTQIGTVTGLHGVNCRHSEAPFFEGISHNPFEEIDEKANLRKYKETQKARSMERGIRADKRELMGLEELLRAAPDNAEVREKRDKLLGQLRRETSRYYSYMAAVGLKPREISLYV